MTFRKKLFILFSLTAWAQYSLQKINWCDPQYECNGEKHTMCKYNKSVSDNISCQGLVDGMAPESRQRILGLHNYVRNYFASGSVPGWPEAANMRQVTWDDTLAEVAQMWAFQCTQLHDKCRKTPQFEDVGQNLGVAASDKEHPDGVYLIFRDWLDQVSLMTGMEVKRYKSNSKYDDFAAIVWADTYKIGCGLVNYTSTSIETKVWKQTMVCNYAPAGAKDGKPMWVEGEPCKTCPKVGENATSCPVNTTYLYLCALPDDPIEDPVVIDIPACQAYAFAFKSLVLLAVSAALDASVIT